MAKVIYTDGQEIPKQDHVVKIYLDNEESSIINLVTGAISGSNSRSWRGYSNKIFYATKYCKILTHITGAIFADLLEGSCIDIMVSGKTINKEENGKLLKLSMELRCAETILALCKYHIEGEDEIVSISSGIAHSLMNEGVQLRNNIFRGAIKPYRIM